MSERKASALIAVAMAIAMLAAPWAASHAAEERLQPAQVITRLQQQNAELAKRNEALERRIHELETRGAGDGATLQSSARASRLADVAMNDREYRFLALGEGTDYLRAERHRIVDQIEQAIPPLYEPARPLHGYVLAPGTARVKLGVGFAHNPGNFGRDDLYAKFFDNVVIDTLGGDLDFGYGFEAFGLHDLMIDIDVPFKMVRHKGTGHPFRIDPMEMTMEGTSAGLGDIGVTLKKKWFDQGNGPVTLSSLTGVILPTGKDDQQFNASQTVFVNGRPMQAVSALLPGNPAIDVFSTQPGERFFPRATQPGQGSWGGRVGVAATRQFERSAVHAGVVYDFFRKRRGITPGNEVRYGVSHVFPPLESDRLSIDTAIFGRYKRAEKFPGLIMHPERDPTTGMPIMDANGNMALFVTERPEFKHGNVVFFSPSVSFIASPAFRLTLSPAVRIHEPRQGPSPAWTLDISAQHTF